VQNDNRLCFFLQLFDFPGRAAVEAVLAMLVSLIMCVMSATSVVAFVELSILVLTFFFFV